MELAGLAAGTEHDQVDVAGIVSLAGNLDMVPLAPYTDPTLSGTADTFDIILAGVRQGTFDAISYDGTALPGTFVSSTAFRSYQGAGLFRIVEYESQGVTFLNYRALPGDANGDLVVDGSDFGIWNAHKFTSGTDWLTGDFNGDGITDGSDFGIWNAHKFTTATRLSHLIPEPGVWWLLATAVALARRITSMR